jgi:hypothetical protein
MEDQEEISFTEFWDNFGRVITKHGKHSTKSKWDEIKNFTFETWVECFDQKKRKREMELLQQSKKAKQLDKITIQIQIVDIKTNNIVIPNSSVKNGSKLCVFIKNSNEEKLSICHCVTETNEPNITDNFNTINFIDMEPGENKKICIININYDKGPLYFNIVSTISNHSGGKYVTTVVFNVE